MASKRLALTHFSFLFKRRVERIAWIAGELFKLEGKRKKKRKAAVRSNHLLLGQRNAELVSVTQTVIHFKVLETLIMYVLGNVCARVEKQSAYVTPL